MHKFQRMTAHHFASRVAKHLFCARVEYLNATIELRGDYSKPRSVEHRPLELVGGDKGAFRQFSGHRRTSRRGNRCAQQAQRDQSAEHLHDSRIARQGKTLGIPHCQQFVFLGPNRFGQVFE